MLDEVVDGDVVLEDGAVEELVVAVDIEDDVPVLMLVSVDELVVDAADVSAELEVEVVDDPHAAIAARAPAAAKLRIKRMLSSSRNWERGAFEDQTVSRLGAI